MKKLMLALFIALGMADIAAAQDWGGPWGNQGWTAQPLTVSGTLQLQNGTIAVVNGSTVYYVPALERFIGFIDAIKEGAQASVDGYAAPSGNYLQATKLTIGGKSYDLVANDGLGHGPGWRGSPGHGPGGYWHGRGGWCRGHW
ncbi:MAG: hypothetical protein LBI87_10905 [Candidatus Accumulibacter sp.]|jgi:hypothetical protein|nr:hypothetical protein [Accumulibacter sp.]